MINLSNLHNIYTQSLDNHHPTIAFELREGGGVFVFMMFFSEEDESRDQLFILLKRTQRMIKYKMYGNHRKGNFNIYPNPEYDNWIKEELGIIGGQTAYEQEKILEKLNKNIPQNLPLTSTIETIHNNRNMVSRTVNLVDEEDKIYLLGPRKLSEDRHPREKTIRKLYLYVEAEPRLIKNFIEHLRKNNMTLAWTHDPNRANYNLAEMMR